MTVEPDIDRWGYDVLDKGTVELVDYLGSDLSIVRAARVSFNKSASTMGEAETGLINFLMRQRHGTPFESVVFQFQVKAPIFVAREWFRHRVGSFNEWSGRYSVLDAEFYIPDHVRKQVGKPGAYIFEPIVDPAVKAAVRTSIADNNEGSYERYNDMLNSGIAKEVARLVLPVNIYTKFVWTVNLRALLNFLSLRNDDNAQYEIREYAKAIELLVAEVAPVALLAFTDNERVAP